MSSGRVAVHTPVAEWTTYNFAILRVVPHVHLGAFTPVGVILHARTIEFLEMKVITDIDRLQHCIPDIDTELLARYLRSCEAIARGDIMAGPVALAPPSERFHWLTAPRSDVLQSSPTHEGLSANPALMLDQLFTMYIGD